MAKNEEGEFELILGNRQLVSVFLIVVILLAVFFSMGYIVGRNSASGVDTAQNTKITSPEVQKDSPSAPVIAQESPTPPPDEPRATPEPEKPSPLKDEKPAVRAEHSTAASVKESKPDPSGPTASPGEPAPGQYWQVVATARPDAEIIAEALGKKGFHALVVPAPREGVFRVVVGPLKDPAAQAQTRTSLEAAGFKNPLMRKY